MKFCFTKTFLSALLGIMSATSYGADKTDDKKNNASKSAATSMDVYNLSLSELGQVQISIATGNSTPLDKAPATASVIYAAEIESMGARTLDDVLETVPGLHISLSSLSRLDSVESIRGVHSGFNPQVLLLMNGVPVQYSLQGGRPTLFRLPVASIERVEVIRGPGSAIYGADAYAGVVNVITKDANATKATQIGARAGSFNTHDMWVQTATEWQGMGIAFDLAYLESDGDDDRKVNSDLQSALDEKLGTNASLAPGALSTRYQIFDSHLSLTGENLQINLWNWVSRDAGVGVGAAQALDPSGSDDSDLIMGDLSYQLGAPEHWNNSVRLSYMRYEEEAKFTLLPAGTVVPIGRDGNLDFVAPAGVVAFPEGLKGNPGGVSKDGQFEFVSLYSGFDSQRIRFAAGARYQNLRGTESKNFGPGVLDITPLPASMDGALTNISNSPDAFLDDNSREIRYVSLQDEWKILQGLDLTAGVRYDDYSDFGSTTNPRVALVWTASEDLTTKLLYGSAFRAPSFAELYYKNNPVSIGNTELKPEQMNTLELSFNYRFADTLQTNLTLFKYRATDMIEFVDNVDTPDASKYANNIRDQDGKGVEFEVIWKPSAQLHLNASYSTQSAVDGKTEAAIPDAPGKQFKVNVNWMPAAQWSLNSQLHWIGDRERAVDDPRPDVANYTLLNFTLIRKNILPELDLSFAVRNAANTTAREPSSITIPDDYPLESRNIWLGLTYAFK
ncbi:MAG: TonB-dependent receptor [Gammaproteobacteria bacterium]|nr:MAG: TonB-dependent receptor [Gammaproteobacteria bacterium]